MRVRAAAASSRISTVKFLAVSAAAARSRRPAGAASVNDVAGTEVVIVSPETPTRWMMGSSHQYDNATRWIVRRSADLTAASCGRVNGRLDVDLQSGLFRRPTPTRASGPIGIRRYLVQPADQAQHMRLCVATLFVLPREVCRPSDQHQLQAWPKGKPRESRYAANHPGHLPFDKAARPAAIRRQRPSQSRITRHADRRLPAPLFPVAP